GGGGGGLRARPPQHRRLRARLRLPPRGRRGVPGSLSEDRPPPHGRALDGRGPPAAAGPPRPLRRVQPALRPRHDVRPQGWRQHRHDPLLHAAAGRVDVTYPPKTVMAGLVPATQNRGAHGCSGRPLATPSPPRFWVAGPRPAMTTWEGSGRG